MAQNRKVFSPIANAQTSILLMEHDIRRLVEVIFHPIEAKSVEPLTREQQMLRKVYEIAREHWQKHGDTERLALTDEELDKQFW